MSLACYTPRTACSISFQCLLELVEKYHPQYLLHGHVHLRYNLKLPREQEYQGTKIITVSERYALEVPDRPFPEKDRDMLIWKTRHREPRDDEEITRTPFRPY